MRKPFVLLLAIVAMLLSVLPFAFANASVPQLAPAEIANMPAATVSAINKSAHWIWQILVTDEAAKIFNWLLTTGVSVLLGWLGLTGTRLARCVMYIAAGVRDTYLTFVRPAKKAARNGKLTEADRVKAMSLALDYAQSLASTKSLDLFKYLSKDVATTVAEFCIRIFKGGKKAEVLIPLSDSAPLPSSVTSGMKSAWTSEVSG